METAQLTGRIESVTVFQEGARVTRVADLPAGNGNVPDQIRLTNLPLCLDDDSIRVRVEGAADTLPVATDLRVGLDVPALDDSLPPAVDEDLRAARQEEKRLASRLNQLEDSHRRLLAVQLPGRPIGKEGEPPPPSAIESRLAFLTFQRERSAVLRQEREELAEELRSASRRRLDLEEQDRRATSARQAKEEELRKCVMISMKYRSGTSPARLILEYNVPGARWAPAYTFRFDRGLTTAEVNMRAMVFQRTGEDWTGVRLTLSTARPQTWADLPELTSLRIGRLQPTQPGIGWRPPPTGTQALYADFDRAFEQTVPPSPRAQPAPAARGLIPEDEAMRTLGIRRRQIDEFVARGTLDREDVHGRPMFRRRQIHRLRSRMARGAPPDDEDALVALEAPAASSETRVFSEKRLDRMRAAGAVSTGIAGEDLEEADSAMVTAAPPRSAPAAVGGAIASVAKSLPAIMSLASAPRPASTGADAGMELADLGDQSGFEPILRYGNMRMPGPDDPDRGKLCRADADALYLELMTHVQIEVSIDVRVAVMQAQHRAHAVGESWPPRSHQFPTTKAGFDYAYVAETAVDVPSDGQFHSVPVITADARATRKFVTVPRMSQEVFRVAELENPLDAILPDGPADILIGGDFLLTAPLHDVAARGKVQLGLGVEQGIKVARNTHFREATTGILAGSLGLQHEIEIAVTNHLPDAADIEVRERVPVPKKGQDKIKVEVGTVEPAWDEYRPPDQPALQGNYHWNVRVEPGQSQNLSATYTVQIPSKYELVGGNRREE